MHKGTYKALAVFCVLMVISSVSETSRIMTSAAPDIASQRTYLTIMAFGVLIALLFLARYLWRKSE